MIDIKLFRRDNNLSQIELAKILGCTQGFISSIERKIRPIPESIITKLLSFPNYNTRHLISEEKSVSDVNKTISDNGVIISREVFDVLKNLSETVLSQQRTIENISTETKKTTALKEDGATCADASGSDLEK